jgi:hypothetical protein
MLRAVMPMSERVPPMTVFLTLNCLPLSKFLQLSRAACLTNSQAALSSRLRPGPCTVPLRKPSSAVMMPVSLRTLLIQ